MAIAHVHDEAFLAPLPDTGFGTPNETPEELFRWACFLDQGQPQSVTREHSVDALLEAAADDRDLLVRSRHYAVRALAHGVGTRGVVDLLQDALDRTDRAD
jgi:hypothetical protein